MSDIQHIDAHTQDLTEENVEKLAALFPDVLTEVADPQTGETKQAIDFDALRDKLGDVVENTRERYQFTWPGKRAAKAEARKPISKTLRPVKERSKDWDTTQNLYIEGDNLDALKILRETYAGKIKLIYIDPPYNTGHDFIYKDNFSKTVAADKAESGDYDEEGGQLVANPESNGRFHSDWCSMIYPRLLLARDLLKSDGVIFISIDDSELFNLKKICDEIFGIENFRSDIAWQKRYTRSNNTVDFTTVIEHMLVYAKSGSFVVNLLPRTQDADDRYSNPDSDPRGPWKGASFLNPATPAQRPNLCYPITNPNTGKTVNPTTNAWRRSKEEFDRLQADRRLYWGIKGTNDVPSVKMFLSEARGLTPINYWEHTYAGNTDQGSAELADLMGCKGLFDFPKPSLLIQRVLEHGASRDSIILDFFSGSASTAQAVMNINAEDDGTRQFILVQLPEAVSDKSEAAKAGYSTICEIGEERIRRAGEKIKAEVEAENGQGKLDGEVKRVPDIGFRVLRVDSSSYEDVRKTPAEFSQGALDLDEDNTKEGRSPLDLLFECLPTFQLPYTSSIDVLSGEPFDGHTVYSVNGGQLLACFDSDIPESLIHGMANFDPKPSYAVVAEKSLPDSAARTNFAEIFKQSANALEGQTQIRII